MAIPSKEIGWGTEENLLWQISKQLETLTNVTYSSGSSSTTYVPYTGAISNVNLGSYNISANSFINGFSSITASGTQVVLTVNSAPEILVSGSGGQTIKLPDATTLANGTTFSFNNNQSSGAISVNNNSNTLVLSIPSGGYAEIMLLSNSTAAGSWDKHFQAPSNVSWSTNTLDYPGSITSATWNGVVVAPNRGGTGQSTYTDGQLLIGNTTGNTLSKSTLTAGTGISIANGNGSITITATGAVAGAITGSGTTNYVPKFTSASVIGNSNIQDSGSLITLGSNTYISSGGLGIGTTSLTGVSLGIVKTLTGATTAYGVSNYHIIAADVTANAYLFSSYWDVYASTLALSNLFHYRAATGVLTAGSTITNQYGFYADSFFGTATNNYVFYSGMNAATNRWNLYMAGTANNYMAGALGIGTVTLGSNALRVNGLTQFNGTTASDTAPLGAQLAAVTGTGTSWTLSGTDLNVGGYLHTAGDTTALTTTLAATSGTYYQIIYTITSRTAGSITIDYGGTSTSGITSSSNVTPLTTSTAVLTITPTSDFNGNVVLSIKTIGTSSASSSFGNSSSGNNIEFRASSSNQNTFIGQNAGSRNINGVGNSFFGVLAGQNNTTGASNTLIGWSAGVLNTTGTNNTFIGYQTGQRNTTGSTNTVLGVNAFGNNLTGGQNIAIGYDAGSVTTSCNYSIYIGFATRASANGNINEIVIGTQNTTGLGSNSTIIGTSATTLAAIYGNLLLGSTSSVGSFKLQVTGASYFSTTMLIGGTTANASALLQADSTSQGVLFPRMTTTQKNAISSPATGLVIFDTTLGKLCVFSTTWQTITSA